MFHSVLLSSPDRALLSDDPADVLRFAVEASLDGKVALGTLVEIQSGAARTLGSQVAGAGDGRFCGYVSGGCVQPAVAAEALGAMDAEKDRSVRFGEGSPFFDIVLPCGGGITVTIHIVTNVDAYGRYCKPGATPSGRSAVPSIRRWRPSRLRRGREGSMSNLSQYTGR